MHYRLDEVELAERMKHFQSQLLPPEIHYDENTTMQGVY
jgi:hypothetical protein